jgi:hypothetical protein
MYGVESSTSNSSGTGKNFGWKLVQFDLNEQGSLEIRFEKHFPSGKSLTLRTWFNEVKREDFESDGEMAKAKQRLTRNLNSIVKQYAGDSFKMNPCETFVDYVAELKANLPEGYETKEGYLVIGYNTKGYLSFRNSMQWNNEKKRFLPFFSLSDCEMCDMGNLKESKEEEIISQEDIASGNDFDLF